MSEDNVITFANPAPESMSDPLTEVWRQGARRLLAEAVEAEVEQFLAHYQALRDAGQRQRVVRKGYLPERTLQTGMGAVEVKVPRVRDRGAGGEAEPPIRFDSARVPQYLRKSASVEQLIPCLYLAGRFHAGLSGSISSAAGRAGSGVFRHHRQPPESGLGGGVDPVAAA